MAAVRFCSHCGSSLAARPPTKCGRCGVEHWRNAKPAAGALVQDDRGRLLLVRRGRPPWVGFWDLPGGFCDHDEAPEETARREVAEEVGAAIEIVGILGLWLDRYDPEEPDEDAMWCLNVYYFARLTADATVNATPTDHGAEVSDIAWFFPEELPRQIAFPDHAAEVLSAWQQRQRGS